MIYVPSSAVSQRMATSEVAEVLIDTANTDAKSRPMKVNKIVSGKKIRADSEVPISTVN